LVTEVGDTGYYQVNYQGLTVENLEATHELAQYIDSAGNADFTTFGISGASGAEVAAIDNKGNASLNSLTTSTISSDTGSGLTIGLDSGQTLAITGSGGSQVAAIDSSGNAEFNGTVSASAVTAPNVVADQVGTPYPMAAEVNPGDVVAVNSNGDISDSTSPFQVGLVGVVAEQAGLTVDNGNNNGSNTANVAVAGQVPVNVIGPVTAGDPLTSSNVSGVAMAANGNGPIIGVATTSFTGSGEGQVLVNVGNSFMGSTSFSQSISDLENSVSNLQNKVQTLQQNTSSNQDTGLTDADGNPVNFNSLAVGNLTVNLNLVVTGALTVNGSSTFKGNTTFNGSVTFNQNTAGYAVIHVGQQSVNVSFQQPYTSTPIINVSLGNDMFSNYSYSDVTTSGFTINLPIPATQDMQFSWTATAVNNPITSDQPLSTP
jgi:hypothetical protein